LKDEINQLIELEKQTKTLHSMYYKCKLHLSSTCAIFLIIVFLLVATIFIWYLTDFSNVIHFLTIAILLTAGLVAYGHMLQSKNRNMIETLENLKKD